ncbi:MAG: helix-turn-helix domain-containing protein [Thermomicrobiales bacterium]
MMLDNTKGKTMALHDRIKQRREEKGLAAIELAQRAEISKGYLSEIESGRASRPSGDVLFRIATVLGTTVADLLEREVRPASRAVHPMLRALATEEELPDEDVQMLAQIRFRGDQPETKEDWRYLYESIRRSIGRRP